MLIRFGIFLAKKEHPIEVSLKKSATVLNNEDFGKPGFHQMPVNLVDINNAIRCSTQV